MKRIIRFSLVLLIGANLGSGIIWADEVTDWNGILFQAAHTANTNPLVTTRVTAIVQAAVFDAVNGIERQFYDYYARGAPYGPDDGTIAPWVVVASLPFAPEVVIPTVRSMAQLDLGATKRYGFKPSFNQTYEVPNGSTGYWVTPYHFGVDQGPVILMIENYRTGLIWNIMRRSPYVVAGLRRAGFRGGWLDGSGCASERGSAKGASNSSTRLNLPRSA